MERRAIHEDPDGYYFRSPTGKLYGPLSRFQFEAWSMRGAVGPGSKVWRQQGAHHYRVEISRRLKWQKLLSVRSCGAMSDWLMTFISVVSLVFLFSVKKLRDDLRKELRGHAATGVFLFLLFAATVVLSVSAMRKLSKRVVTESTDLFDHEV
jgi:hypothetical protein|tara:strand:- start:2 stop:457 length:456 start_codon:yes stop_codon:yes gene_type:complete